MDRRRISDVKKPANRTVSAEITCDVCYVIVADKNVFSIPSSLQDQEDISQFLQGVMTKRNARSLARKEPVEFKCKQCNNQDAYKMTANIK